MNTLNRATEDIPDLKINHLPFGFHDIYHTDSIFRQPCFPLEGDRVAIKVGVMTVMAIAKVFLQFSVNGIMQDKKEMELSSFNEKETIFCVSLDCFAFGDIVEYNFAVESQDKQIVSRVYNFNVRKWFNITNFTSIGELNGEVLFDFESSECGNVTTLGIASQNGNTLRCRLHFKNTTECKPDSANKEFILNNGYHIKAHSSNTSLSILNREYNNILDMGAGYSSIISILTDITGKIYKVRINIPLTSDEKIYGTGERYSDIQFIKQVIDNYVYDQFANQRLRTYLPVPYYISSQGYGIYIDSSAYSVFDFGHKNPERIELEINLDVKQKLEFYVFAGTPKNIIEAYTDIVGKPQLPPKWAFGPWMSSNNWDSQQEVLKQVELSKIYKIPATVIVLEQWSDEATFYIFNDTEYIPKSGENSFSLSDFYYPEDGRWPNPKVMVDYLHQQGIKVLLWQIPVMKNMSEAENVQRHLDESAMIKNNFCLKRQDRSLYRIPSHQWFAGSLVMDFTNPDARKWWFGKRAYLIDEIGIDGFKTDGGECIFGDEVIFCNGSYGDMMRNQYPLVYIKSYNEFINRHRKEKGILFSRSGFAGIQNHTLQWAGDEKSTFEAFKSSLRAGLNCGVSGIAFWGWDFAGFSGDIPTAELYLRAAAMSVFCPIMQYHSEPSYRSNDRTPWNIAQRTGRPDVIETFAKLANLRINILPYIYHEALHTSKQGTPLMRAMFMEFPDDKICSELWDQYMFGDNMLIAPIVQEGKSNRQVYLPKGFWMDLFTKTVFEGGRFVDVYAQIGEIPVFIRQNSIIPLNLCDEFCLGSYVGNATEAYTNLSFMIFMPDNIIYSFVDDQDIGVNFKISRRQDRVEIICTASQNVTINILINNYAAKLQANEEETVLVIHLKE